MGFIAEAYSFFLKWTYTTCRMYRCKKTESNYDSDTHLFKFLSKTPKCYIRPGCISCDHLLLRNMRDFQPHKKRFLINNISYSFMTGDLCYSVGDKAWRIFGGLGHDELTYTFPYPKLLEIAEQIKHTTDYINNYSWQSDQKVVSV